MNTIGATTDYRLIGGVAVLLHIQRLGLDLPLRSTGDADFGVPPHLLKDPALIPRSNRSGTRRLPATGGNGDSTIAALPRSTYSCLITPRGRARPDGSGASSPLKFPDSRSPFADPGIAVKTQLLVLAAPDG